MVLQDRYGARALLTLDPDGLTIRVRGLNPQAFLDHLMHDTREYVEDFWKGLTTQVLVPCQPPCGLGQPGRGLFDLDGLYGRLGRGKDDYPCPVTGCHTDVEIAALLRGLGARQPPGDQLASAVAQLLSGTIDERLERHTQQLLAAQEATARRVLTRIDRLDDDTKAAFSRGEQRLAALLRALNDDGVDGPRLFTLEPLDRSLRHPGVTSQRMRLTLWCEHSRLPVHVLDPDRPNAGVYTVDVPREWWAKAAPVIRAASVALKTLLPVSIAVIELDLNENQWNAVKKEITLGKEAAAAAADTAHHLTENAAVAEMGSGLGIPVRAEGGLLRILHSTLRAQDITFADLRRVTHQGQYLWVHHRFVPVYQPPPPQIPT